jgi:hypothetical protein
LSNLDPIKAHCFSHDFGVAQETVLAGVSPGRTASGATAWSKWIAFTSDLGIDPFLQTFNDKIPFLQIFAQQVHSGELAVRGNPLRAQSAEDYIRHVAQTFLNLGGDDPRLNSANKIDFRLQRTLAAWKLTDPAPLQVKPIPISVIRQIATLATENTTPTLKPIHFVSPIPNSLSATRDSHSLPRPPKNFARPGLPPSPSPARRMVYGEK